MKVFKAENGTWTVTGIPIVETGIEYLLSTGPHTFTAEELADAALAYNDVAISSPRHKLGHNSQFNAAIGDGEPAFGTFENLTVGDRGQTLYADLEGCPEWLATILPMAFPSRSVEALPDVDTVTGHHYSMVITAVSALGIYWPGCSVLEDLPKWYGAEIPEGVTFDTEVAAEIAAQGGGMRLRREPGVKAAVDTAAIRRKFYSTANWSWWIRAEKYDGGEGMYLIIDDEETGDLLKVGVTVDGSEIEFSDPVKVIEEHVPVAARASVVLGMSHLEPALAVHASRADTDDRPPPTTKGASDMDEAQRKKLAASLGLPENSTPEQIQEKLLANAIAASETPPVQDPATPEPGHEPPAPPSPSPGPATPPPPGEEEGDEEEEGNGEETTNAGAQIVQVDKKVWDETVAGARIARESAAAAHAQAITDELSAALHAGKIKPADEATYKALLTRDFDQGKAVLATLQPGVVPVEERGGAGNAETNIGDGGANAGLPTEWFPPRAFAAARGETKGRVTQAREG